MQKILFIILIFISVELTAQQYDKNIQVGASQISQYLPQLNNKKVALLVNQTSMINQTHLVDTLLNLGIEISKIFAPEHGFRGDGDAGEKIKSGIDTRTGLSVTSMYGASKKPSKESMQGIDIVLFDIQDVGARFYTYISSLQYMMEACAEAGVPLIVLDRPNPNGFYVDGPVLELSNKSFVGMQAIPIVHGMTVGEYAKMLNGEKWLTNKKQCDLKVISCKGYSHNSLYELPIAPSPNLKTMNAIYLYPSLCLFEGTDVSVGRGTHTPFEMWGHPSFKSSLFGFTPTSTQGAKHPPHENKKCFGENLHQDASKTLKLLNRKVDFSFLQNAIAMSNDKSKFFNSFFEKLAGNTQLRKQIIEGKSIEEIRKSWEPNLSKFKAIRKKYLLYEDFKS